MYRFLDGISTKCELGLLLQLFKLGANIKIKAINHVK
jgi:hypothetical protein